MKRTIIFDLSEVLIAGLVGIERPIAARLRADEAAVLSAFGGDRLHELCCGQLTEDAYLAAILDQHGWNLSADFLKRAIRDNFHHRVPGMEDVFLRLVGAHDLILLSDHAAEWIEYIQSIHPFLQEFAAQFYSYALKQTKREPSTFRRVLDAIGREPRECVFVDDSRTNVLTAISLGIPGIQFVGAQQLSRAFDELGVWELTAVVDEPSR